MLTNADRKQIHASLADIRATQRAMLDDIGEDAVIAWLRARGIAVVRDRLPVGYPPDADVVCDTCLRIHNRDTNSPIQCPTCHEIIGCFWHNRNTLHVRVCKLRAQGKHDEGARLERGPLEDE